MRNMQLGHLKQETRNLQLILRVFLILRKKYNLVESAKIRFFIKKQFDEGEIKNSKLSRYPVTNDIR